MLKRATLILALAALAACASTPERRPTKCELATNVCPHGLAVCSSTGEAACFVQDDAPTEASR